MTALEYYTFTTASYSCSKVYPPHVCSFVVYPLLRIDEPNGTSDQPRYQSHSNYILPIHTIFNLSHHITYFVSYLTVMNHSFFLYGNSDCDAIMFSAEVSFSTANVFSILTRYFRRSLCICLIPFR